MKLEGVEGMMKWRRIARDGADLPAHQAVENTAPLTFAAGMIADYEFTPTKPGTLRLLFEEVPPFQGTTPPGVITINVK
jgi:hypothetical protein